MHDKTIRRRRAVLAALVAVSLILLTAYFGESPSSPLHVVQRGVVTVLSPVQSVASRVLSPFRDVAGFVSSTINATSKNGQLQKQVNALNTEVARYKYEATQYQQAEQLLKLNAAYNISSYNPVSTRVIGRNPSLWYDTIQVGAGSADGVKQYDPVIGAGGLVGRVTDVGPNWSSVTLVTSPNFAVGAMIVAGHQSYSGVLQPKVGNPQQLLLSYLPSTAQLQTGDTVVTSGFSETVATGGSKTTKTTKTSKTSKQLTLQSWAPPGIPIGAVSTPATQIQDSLINTQQVDVSPAVDLQQLSIVQILTSPHASNQTASLP